MRFVGDHLGHLLGGAGAGLGASFVYLFQGMIRDTWNDYRARRRIEAAVPKVPTNGNGADRIGAEVTHQLIELLRQDLLDRKTSDDRKWEIISGLKDQGQEHTVLLRDLDKKTDHAGTLLGVLASRRS